MAVAAMAFGMLGDLLMVAYGIVPVMGAGVVSMLRKRDWRAGIAAVTASAAAIVASELVSWLAQAMGAFKSVDGVSVATFAQMLVNLRHVLSYVAGLVGFTYGFDAGRVPTVLQDVHVLGALLIVACSAAAIAKLVRGVVRGRREASCPSRRPGAGGSTTCWSSRCSVRSDIRRPGRQRSAWSPLSSRQSCSPACSAAGSSPRRGNGCDRVA